MKNHKRMCRELPAAWSDFAAWLATAGAEPPRRDAAGAWHLALRYSMLTLPHVLRRAPGIYVGRYDASVPVLGPWGEEIESWEHGMAICSDQRAFVLWEDHWQAGLRLTLTLCPNEPTYRAQLWEAERDLPEEDRPWH